MAVSGALGLAVGDGAWAEEAITVRLIPSHVAGGSAHLAAFVLDPADELERDVDEEGAPAFGPLGRGLVQASDRQRDALAWIRAECHGDHVVTLRAPDDPALGVAGCSAPIRNRASAASRR